MNNIYYKTNIMNSKLLNEVNEIKKKMGLITETEKSVEFLDLDKVVKSGGVKIRDGNNNDITEKVNFNFERPAIIIKVEPRLFDKNEELQIDIKGLVPEEVILCCQGNKEMRPPWPNIYKELKFFNYVDDDYSIKLPLSLLGKFKDAGDTAKLRVKGNVKARNRRFDIGIIFKDSEMK